MENKQSNPFLRDLDYYFGKLADKDSLEFKSSDNNQKKLLRTIDILEEKVTDPSTINLLKTKLCYVNVQYDDNSVLVIYTTLNKDILADYYANFVEGYLFDVTRYRQIPLDVNFCESITISETNIYEDNEVIMFINQFI